MRQLKIQKSITNRSSEALDKYLVEIGRAPLISIDEEIELAQKIKKGGREGEKAKDKLVTANLRFVVSVAKQYQHQGLTLTDLIDEGNIGLIKAAQKFDETRGFKFISYAVWWIRQSILQAIAEQSRIVRLPLNQVGSLSKINHEINKASGKPVFVKIGRFGPVVQIGTADDNEKPRFAQLPADKSLETITLDEALELFKLPRNLGQFEGSDVVIGAGRFGPYVLNNRKYVSVPKTIDPMEITFEEAVALIEDKRKQEEKRHLKKFDEESDMEVMNGRFGPYIAYNGKNYRLPKALHAKAAELTLEQCMEVVNKAKK